MIGKPCFLLLVVCMAFFKPQAADASLRGNQQSRDLFISDDMLPDGTECINCDALHGDSRLSCVFGPGVKCLQCDNPATRWYLGDLQWRCGSKPGCKEVGETCTVCNDECCHFNFGCAYDVNNQQQYCYCA